MTEFELGHFAVLAFSHAMHAPKCAETSESVCVRVRKRGSNYSRNERGMEKAMSGGQKNRPLSIMLYGKARVSLSLFPFLSLSF